MLNANNVSKQKQENLQMYVKMVVNSPLDKRSNGKMKFQQQDLFILFISKVPTQQRLPRDIIECLNRVAQWHPAEMALAFDQLETFALNLIDFPWKKEFRTISTYSGFYKSRLELYLGDPSTLFKIIGYQNSSDFKLRLTDSPDHQTIIRAAFDFFLTAVECRKIEQMVELKIGLSAYDIYMQRLVKAYNEDDIFLNSTVEPPATKESDTLVLLSNRIMPEPKVNITLPENTPYIDPCSVREESGIGMGDESKMPDSVEESNTRYRFSSSVGRQEQCSTSATRAVNEWRFSGIIQQADQQLNNAFNATRYTQSIDSGADTFYDLGPVASSPSGLTDHIVNSKTLDVSDCPSDPHHILAPTAYRHRGPAAYPLSGLTVRLSNEAAIGYQPSASRSDQNSKNLNELTELFLTAEPERFQDAEIRRDFMSRLNGRTRSNNDRRSAADDGGL